jgi:hypothetical protein
LDQRPDAALSLAYTSAPVKADTEVTGVPTVRLYVSSTADVAVFVVKLCDLAPDGATALITRGSLNGAHRVSHQKPRPLIPEQVYELDVALKATSYVVRKGHRIQVLVASADFPWLWPTAQTAVNTVHRNSSCPSAITFTVVPPRLGDQPRPRLKTSPRKSPPRPKATHYRIVHDRMAGTTTTSWGTHNEGKLAEGGGYAFDLRVIMTGSDRSPEDVVVEGEAAFTTRQAESTVQVNSHSKVRSDAGSFHAELSIEVIDNGAPYWQRTWSRAFPRRLM